MMKRLLSRDNSGASVGSRAKSFGKQAFRWALKARILKFAVLCFLFMVVVFTTRVNGVLAQCDPSTETCASIQTSVSDPIYTPYTPSTDPSTPVVIAITPSCSQPPCIVTGVAQPDHGTVSFTPEGMFTYTRNPDYRGPDTIQYTMADGSSAKIEMFVCTAYPCALSNPTADIGTLEFIDDPDDDPDATLAIKYTPDLSRLGETAHLGYDVTDKNGDFNRVEFGVAIPSFPDNPNTKTGTNDAPRNESFRVNSAGTSYDPKHHGNAFFKGDPGPNGGAAENLNVANSGNIVTSGDNDPGIEAKSIGGTAGGGENGGTKMIVFLRFYGSGGRGGWGGKGGDVTVKNTADIVTSGNHSYGIMAQSKGGDGGDGGRGSGFVSSGGAGGAGGPSGNVTVQNWGNLTTTGDDSDGIRAESLAGNGGNGGNGSGVFTNGGNAGFGVHAGNVTVESNANISTEGSRSAGIVAQSVGGGGAKGGSSKGVFAQGGFGGGAGNGGTVNVASTGAIATHQNASNGIFAQSVGGGGGGGGDGGGWFAVGGNGASAGDGGEVSVTTRGGPIATHGEDSTAIFAQSVGGGGGGGGSATAVGAILSLAVGGGGGFGGKGGQVTVDNASSIATTDERSHGILAQSLGGGGGSGGYSIAASVGPFQGSLSFGGEGGDGGDGGQVAVASVGGITTAKDDSSGILAQSLGGGGGNGGFSIAGGISSGASVNLSFGGGGGRGGKGQAVTVGTEQAPIDGEIATSGDRSCGILAQSIGGGGGNGGFSIAGAIGTGVNLNLSMGGSGSSGGEGGPVDINSASSITTEGHDAHAIFAQSVGGGGGSGGFSIAGSIGTGTSINAGFGGTGAGGSGANKVTVNSSGDTISTGGERSYGILAQSIGGGGGDGGFSVAGALGGAALGLSFGGSGGAGGVGGEVDVASSSSVLTVGNDSHAIFAQSVGGGGGSGGFSVAGSLGAGAAGLSFGGSGGAGASAGRVNVASQGDVISTAGDRAYGLLAQSIGGSGGDGGFSVTGGISYGPSVNFSMGGSGGEGSTGGEVTLSSSSSVSTLGDDSHGIFAQSVGGGGGSGGFSVTGGVSANGAEVGASIGGSGGTGASAGKVSVTSTGETVNTTGDRAYGILAQSIGGTGGDGGFSVAGGISNSATVNFSMGGSGGEGSTGGEVELASSSSVSTLGKNSHAIFAQSVGGGGGSGGFSVTGGISAESAAIGASIGGSGAGGGDAGTVTVRSTGEAVNTTGDRAYGILAQSIGGTGGDGGFSVAGGISKGPAIDVSVGGFGARGGVGDAVSVGSSTNILTQGSLAYGILAQSIGGGGGSGGFSFAGSLSKESGGLTASLGGGGAGGGDAGTVNLNNSGAVSTLKGGSHAIFAQSVGGGGGAGGFSGSIAGGFGDSSNLGVSVGGFAEKGGDGKDVTVDNTGDISTRGNVSYGLFGQSVGGGGGDGGGSLAVALGLEDKKANLSLSVGGFAGGGGDGGNVALTNSGCIATEGDKSHAIVAQSVGGGGGTGGFSATGSLSKGTDAKEFALSIGGGGGDGGDAGSVTVKNSGNISTVGRNTGSGIPDDAILARDAVGNLHDGAMGILAQSIGGGGGSGGFGFSGSFGGSESKNLSVGVGGGGGDGGKGSTVIVGNSGVIDTSGQHSYGILAQSIGGGGGRGGSSVAVGTGFGGAKDTWNLNLSVSIGGSGGDGNVGGDVEVSNQGNIITRDNDARGIFAQSIGGGGGNGGSSLTATIGLGAANEGRTVNGNLSVGGAGGEGNDGGEVSVDNSGSISTFGDKSDAVFAQSIGGGGGNGGTSRGLSLLLKFGSADLEKGQTSGANWKMQVNVGGNGGTANDGGSVSVNNQGDIVTQGALSRGIYAQSIGGGGGSGGDGILGTATAADFVTLAEIPFGDMGGSGNWFVKKLGQQLRDLSFSVGGNTGSSGNAGDVAVKNTGAITTLGYGSTGIFSQSVGGGGGEAQSFAKGADKAGSAVSGLTGKFAIGGEGGAGGDGGAVSVDNSGAINTFGDGAYGIFAQSVGGGGGVAGNVDRFLKDYVNLGIGVGFGRSGGAGGNGADVTVTNAGNITTYGAGAHGIFAQSVGGGGGIAGDVGRGIGFAGSVGAAGSAGSVKVTSSGDITTVGEVSHGIFAQSAGGKDYGGDVEITLSGDIAAAGKDSNGILVQSRGDKGAGNISVSVLGGTVQGGSGDAAGVRFLDGMDNSLTNFGTVMTVGGVEGMAVMGSAGNEGIDNYGTITGTVDLGEGANSFNNRAGGMFNAGQTVNLGEGNVLTNAGTLSPAGKGTVQATTLTGNLTQTNSGAYAVDLDFAELRADRLNVSGTSNVAGAVEINPLNTGWVAPGTQQLTILSSPNGLTTSGLSLSFQPSAVIEYELRYPDATDVAVSTAIDFAPDGLSPNQAAIAKSVNAIQRAGGSESFAPVASELCAMPEIRSLGFAYDQLSPATYDDFTLMTLYNSKQFTTTFQQRMNTVRNTLHAERMDSGTAGLSARSRLELAYNGTNASLGELLSERRRAQERLKYGLWLQPFGQWGARDGTDGQAGLDFDATGISGGFDYLVSENLVAGIGMGYLKNHIDLDDNVGSGTIDGLGGSLYGTYFADKVYLQGVFSYARNNYENTRQIAFGSFLRTARSEHDGNAYSASLEGGYHIRLREWTFQPFALLDYLRLDEQGFDEEGAGGANLKVEGRQTDALFSEVGLRLGRAFEVDSGRLIPEFKVGWLHDFDIDDRRITASFIDFPGTAFTITPMDLVENGALIGAGIAFVRTGGFTASVEYEGEFWGDYESHSVFGQIRYDF